MRWRRALSTVVTTTAVLVLAGMSAAPAQALVNGDTAPHAYSFAASLQFDAPDFDVVDEHACGATLVALSWLVTNAHCVTDPPWGAPVPVSAKQFHVSVGAVDRNGGIRRTVDDIVVHPDWNWGAGPGAAHDIALLHVTSPVPKLPVLIAPTSPPPGTTIRQLGWGLTTPDASGDYAQQLQQLDSTVAPTADCAPAGITADELCVAKTANDGGICVGDSGGPMVWKVHGIWYLAASASRSHATYCGGAPTTATDQSALRGWTYSVILHH